MKRQPYITKTTSNPAVSVVRVMGVDPGFASIGACVMERPDGHPIELLEARLLVTKKLAGKKHNLKMRVSADDSRRIKDIWKDLDDMVERLNPSVMAIEWYMPRGKFAGGWKACMTVGVVHSIAMARDMFVITNLPQDVKRAFGLNLSASKIQIAQAVCEKVPPLRTFLDTMAKAKQEHVADAAAHAYLAFAQVAELRQMMGI